MEKSELIVILSLVGLFISLLYLWRTRRDKKPSHYIESALLDAASIPPFSNSIELLNKELSRARRSNCPLSVIVVEHHPTESGTKSSHKGDNSESRRIIGRGRDRDMTVFLRYGKSIRDALRDIDIISYAATTNQFIILLPESTKSEAEDALRRIKGIIGMGADQMLAEVAEFPNDGLILDDLVAHAANLISNRERDIEEDTIPDW
jgi:hypothetical protein